MDRQIQKGIGESLISLDPCNENYADKLIRVDVRGVRRLRAGGGHAITDRELEPPDEATQTEGSSQGVRSLRRGGRRSRPRRSGPSRPGASSSALTGISLRFSGWSRKRSATSSGASTSPRTWPTEECRPQKGAHRGVMRGPRAPGAGTPVTIPTTRRRELRSRTAQLPRPSTRASRPQRSTSRRTTSTASTTRAPHDPHATHAHTHRTKHTLTRARGRTNTIARPREAATYLALGTDRGRVQFPSCQTSGSPSCPGQEKICVTTSGCHGRPPRAGPCSWLHRRVAGTVVPPSPRRSWGVLASSATPRAGSAITVARIPWAGSCWASGRT